jgi:hypothetical protein
MLQVGDAGCAVAGGGASSQQVLWHAKELSAQVSTLWHTIR